MSQTTPSPTDRPLPDLSDAIRMFEAARGQIEFARRYSLELLEATPMDRWYEMPAGASSHVAWQVGHLAVSQYGLLMFRMRGREPEDLKLIPGKFRKTYGRGGKPPESPEGQPTPQELLDKLNRVHELSSQVLDQLDPAELLVEIEMPYAVYPCKLGAVLFCPIHEGLHAGQIGVLRRGLGLESVR
ncbi:DinB family protein [Rhodopirellula sp. JC740]|uniref:DinB family protein n=1 Tax=Rhodopirellula halodulae TaxID=2894198 RepID=A0ABS8NFK1_9BACT|nr:DinB family protein [Rhodopirellula sp. JC740]MCC9642332.1 DinB family protein [Rhodopirellula sp. JC740]